mmetsp:Transcript_117735/g.379937  ORF Transcript_117735/g.379937 Transcript_117735/m.379937 type:complete len:268 (+) Transcript_117735:633-1436(+)
MAKEDSVHDGGTLVHEHRGDVQVHAPPQDVPAQAGRDAAQRRGLGQVHHGALLHGEGDLHPPRRPGDGPADDVADGGLQDVHEVLPVLRRLVHHAQAPGPVVGANHGRHHVHLLLAALHGEASHLVVLPLLQHVDEPVPHVAQVPAAVGGDDEDQHLHVLGHLGQAHPDDLVKTSPLASPLIAGMRDALLSLHVVVVHSVNDGTLPVHHNGLEVHVDGDASVIPGDGHRIAACGQLKCLLGTKGCSCHGGGGGRARAGAKWAQGLRT